MKQKDVIDGIIGYLKSEKLLHLVPELISELKKVNGISEIEATAETAIEMTENEKKDLKELIVQKFGWKDEVNFVVNPGLVGGLKVSVGDQVLDLSVKARLKNIYEQI